MEEALDLSFDRLLMMMMMISDSIVIDGVLSPSQPISLHCRDCEEEDKQKETFLPCAKLPHRNTTTSAATETETHSY